MSIPDKYFFLRIGSNSEKEYVKKVGTLFTGLIAKANYFEAAPGLLSGIFLKFDSLTPSHGYIIDPIPYVFALDPQFIKSWQKVNNANAENKFRTDLKLGHGASLPSGWKREIESPSKRQKNKVEIFTIMRAYRKLADYFFRESLADQIGHRAISPDDLQDDTIPAFVKNVIDYQVNAIKTRFDTSKYEEFKKIIPEPLMILAPYFLIQNRSWLDLMMRIWNSFSSQYSRDNGAIVVQVSIDFLVSNIKILHEAISKIKEEIVFLWIDGFEENTASLDQLKAYRDFISLASGNGKKIVNLYAGGFSPFLFPLGLSGMVNNIGYGMQRDAEPIRGGVPTAQFYIPSLHIREQVLTSYDLIVSNNIGTSKDDYLGKICACPICKAGIIHGLSDFIPFYGAVDFPKSNPESDKKYPTPETLKRCTYHFIFSRLLEYKWALDASKENAIEKLNSETDVWRDSAEHLKRWKLTLK